jgi:hypothetical protein
MHSVLADARGIGEWFNIPMTDAVKTIKAQAHAMDLVVQPDTEFRHLWENYLFSA